MFLRNYGKINKSKFTNDLANQPWENLANISVEEMADEFNRLILDTINKHAPLKLLTSKKKRTPKPSAKLARLRRLRDNARSKKQMGKLRILQTNVTV